MVSFIVGVVLLALFVFFVWQDARRFLNVLLLIAAGFCLFIGFAELTSRNDFIQSILLLLIFIFVPLTLLFMAILLIINGFVMIKKEGRRLKNLLSLFTGVAVIAGMVGTVFAFFSNIRSTLLISLLILVAILSAYFTLTFFALLVYSLLYSLLPKHPDCDYIIVHGCGLLGGERISPLLRGRVDKAVEVFHRTGDKAKLVLSGGQGKDEKRSEAAAMQAYLLEQGFPEDKIVLEDQSTTTYDNLKHVRDLLKTDGKKHKYIFVTSNYHVFRTSLFARELGLDADGVGCKTAAYYWPSAFIREYVAVMVRFKWLTILVIALWLVGAIVSLLPI